MRESTCRLKEMHYKISDKEKMEMRKKKEAKREVAWWEGLGRGELMGGLGRGELIGGLGRGELMGWLGDEGVMKLDYEWEAWSVEKLA